MTKEELANFLIDIDYEYWNNETEFPVEKRDLKVAIVKYLFIADKLKEILDNEYQKGYDTCVRNMIWTDKDPSFWK